MVLFSRIYWQREAEILSGFFYCQNKVCSYIGIINIYHYYKSRYCWNKFPAYMSFYSCYSCSKEDPQHLLRSLSINSSKEDEGGGHTTTTYSRVSRVFRVPISLSFEEEGEGPGGIMARYSSSNRQECERKLKV